MRWLFCFLSFPFLFFCFLFFCFLLFPFFFLISLSPLLSYFLQGASWGARRDLISTFELLMEAEYEFLFLFLISSFLFFLFFFLSFFFFLLLSSFFFLLSFFLSFFFLLSSFFFLLSSFFFLLSSFFFLLSSFFFLLSSFFFLLSFFLTFLPHLRQFDALLTTSMAPIQISWRKKYGFSLVARSDIQAGFFSFFSFFSFSFFFFFSFFFCQKEMEKKAGSLLFLIIFLFFPLSPPLSQGHMFWIFPKKQPFTVQPFMILFPVCLSFSSQRNFSLFFSPSLLLFFSFSLFLFFSLSLSSFLSFSLSLTSSLVISMLLKDQKDVSEASVLAVFFAHMSKKINIKKPKTLLAAHMGLMFYG